MRSVVMALLVLVGPASVVHTEQMQWAGCTANLLEGYHDQPRPCLDCTIGEIVGPKVAIQYYDSNFVSFLDPHGPDILWFQEPHMAGEWRVQFALRSTKDGEVLEMVMGGELPSAGRGLRLP